MKGTLRSNLDPFGQYDDTTLWDALKRSYLVDQTSVNLKRDTGESIELENNEDGQGPSGMRTPVNSTRFSLEMSIEDEGGNLSVGQVRLDFHSSPFIC